MREAVNGGWVTVGDILSTVGTTTCVVPIEETAGDVPVIEGTTSMVEEAMNSVSTREMVSTAKLVGTTTGEVLVTVSATSGVAARSAVREAVTIASEAVAVSGVAEIDNVSTLASPTGEEVTPG